jgi:HlyD family secretion protein
LVKKLIGLVIILGIVAAVGGWYWHHTRDTAVEGFRTVPVKRGDLLAVISATGTVEPEEVVDVGAQVAGKIIFFGKDPSNPGKLIDYRSQVEEGTVLAQIDDSLYKSDVDQGNASVAAANANLQRAQADLEQFKAKLDQAQADWNRAQEVGTKGGLAQSDIDARRAAYLTAKANLAVGEAAIEQGKTGIAQAQATLNRAQTNLGYTTIKSPVKGVIIDRRVNMGQTVVASLNAPSLFLIAKDLTRIQVWASVNEADIGNILAGQPVTFTVDAYPSRTFKGSVNKVRLNATMTQNVVTYTVEVTTNNSDGKLFPYMSANLQFEIGSRRNVLMVPNAALRWFPRIEQVVPEARDQVSTIMRRRSERANSTTASSRPTTSESRERGIVWVPEGQLVKPLRVQIGLADLSNTEIKGEGVEENLQVVIGEQRGETAAASGDQTTNPFAPQFPGRGRSRQ